jgi:uncharacterized repeat protein (TIGR01451 family)
MRLQQLRFTTILAIILLCWGVGNTAIAAGKGDLDIHLTQQKVILQKNGKEELVTANRARPGDVIQYDAKYVNKGIEPIDNLLATLPIPEGMELIENSTLPKSAEASLGDGNFQSIPLKRTVKNKEGKTIVQTVPLTEYRSLRWDVGALAPGKNIVVSARVRVSNRPNLFNLFGLMK